MTGVVTPHLLRGLLAEGLIFGCDKIDPATSAG